MRISCLAIFLLALPLAPALAQSDITLPDRPIARAEVIAAVKRQFVAMDTDHDGIVTRSEFDTYRARQASATPAGAAGPFSHVSSRWFDHADVDGDGRVTLAEAEARPLKLFDMADINHDGTVSVDEARMALMMMRLGGK